MKLFPFALSMAMTFCLTACDSSGLPPADSSAPPAVSSERTETPTDGDTTAARYEVGDVVLANGASMDGLGTNWYWASSQSANHDDYAWFVHYFNGYAADCPKDFDNLHVLAVHAF